MEERCVVIGEAAGKIYRALEKSGFKALVELEKETGITDVTLFQQAVGWLAREAKISFQKKGKTIQISLATADSCCGVCS